MAKVSTLSDDFSGFSLAAKWTNDGTVSLSGTGAMTVTATGVHSTATYDATSSSAYVQVPKIASGGATAPVTNLVFASATSGTALKILKDSGTNLISFQSQVGFSDGSPVSIYYHPMDHAWWRIRDNGTNTFFETSPDGTTWTIRRTITSPVWLNSTTVYLSVDNTPTVGATFDNFNVAPAPVSWYIRKTGSDNNGGSSASTTPDQQGTDGVANNTVTWTAASGNFAYPTDVNKGINIAGTIYRVLSINSATSLLLDRNVPTGSGQTWKLGGALQTFAKVFSTTASAIASGTYVYQSWDNIYVGAGVYRETLSPVASTFSSQVTFIGDTDGTKTGDPGEVMVTAYTTNDRTVPAASTILVMNAGSPFANFWSFKNITFVAGTGNPKYMNLTEGYGNWFINCTFEGVTASNVSSITINLTTASFRGYCFEGCRYHATGAVQITLPTATPGDYEAGVFIRNCLLLCQSTPFTITTSGALAHKGGGIYLLGNTIFMNGAIATSTANVSTSLPVRVENCVLYCSAGTAALNANTSGQIVEDYNIINSSSPRTNVSVGAHSKSDYSYFAPISFGQEVGWGAKPQAFGTPLAGSAALAYGTSGSSSLTDITGIPRASAAVSSLGAFERPNTAVRSTAQTHSGTYSLLLTGPGVQDFDLDVNATSTTVTAWLWYSSGYSGANPQMGVINGGECGVLNTFVSASGTTNAWQQVSLTFTPTSKGRVTIRFISNDTSGTGLVYIDDATVA